MAEIFIGIDFGAVNLKCVRADKKLRGIRLGGEYSTPNAILYNKMQSGDVDKIIGTTALTQGEMHNPENLIVGIKRKLEEKNWRRKIPALNREITAPEVAEDIFKKIYECVANNFSPEDKFHAAVTVPVIFTEHQRQLLKDSAGRAGFEVDAVINESFAALFATPPQDNSLSVIFDFGGSTLDVSVIKVEGEEISELAAGGLRIGGLDIDRAILEKILRPKFAAEIDAAWNFENAVDFQLNFARKIKEALFAADADDFVEGWLIEFHPGFEKIKIARAEIDALLDGEGYSEKIIALLDEVFEELSQGADCFDKSDVTNIYALGGTMNIPHFRNLLEKYFEREISGDLEIEDKNLAVAGGAANFLQLREKIKTANAIPYRVCYSIGENLNLGIAKNMPSGFETLYMNLDLTALNNFGWKIELYQTFSDVVNFENAAYLGEVQLNSELYEKIEPPLLRLKILRDGRIKLTMSERRIAGSDAEIVLVEEFVI